MSLGKRLIEAAHEAVEIARGDADPGTYEVRLPQTIDVRAIRKGLRMTREGFGRTFGFRVEMIREWEDGRAQPDSATRAYLLVIAREPAAVRRALAAD